MREHVIARSSGNAVLNGLQSDQKADVRYTTRNKVLSKTLNCFFLFFFHERRIYEI